MKFEEKGSFITVTDNSKCFVYFLLKDNEVVYVGQTTAGLARPFSHTDKEFDTVKAMPCSIDELDFVEDHFICKYNPKYNKARNRNVIYSLQRVKRGIREDYDMPKFNLPTLKRILKELNITPFIDEYTSSLNITLDDYYKVRCYIEGKLGYEQ